MISRLCSFIYFCIQQTKVPTAHRKTNPFSSPKAYGPDILNVTYKQQRT